MTFLVVILVLTIIFLVLFLWAAVSDLKDWKELERSSSMEMADLRYVIERVKSTLASIDGRLKSLEKAAEPKDLSKGFKVSITYHNGDTQTFEHVHEMGRRDEHIEIIGESGKIIALVGADFRTLIKEENE